MSEDKIISADDALLQERAKLLAELSDITKAADEVTRLREENARLRKALQPFVDRLGVLEETIAHKYAIGTDIDVEHLRAARSAIREGGKDG